MKLSEKIYRHRKQLGISQEELADRLGVTRQAVSKWELGSSLPELETVVALARTFGVSTDYLLSEEEPIHQPEEELPPAQSAARDWLDRLPGVIGSFVKRYGWLSGVYLAVSGGMMTLLGIVVKIITNSMVKGFQNSVDSMFDAFQGQTGNMMGMAGGVDLFGNSMFGGFQESVSAMAQNNPVSILGTIIIVLGLILLIGGTVLAVLLKKRSQG